MTRRGSVFGQESWTSMGRHAQRREKLVSYLSSTKDSILRGRRDWLIIASATTIPKRSIHQSRPYSPRSCADKPVCIRTRLNAWVDPWGLKGKTWFNNAKRWYDKRADEIFGVGKGRSVSGRHYDKTYKGRDIEFKSDNFSKGPRSKDSLERMQKQLDKDIQNKKMGSC